MRSLRVILLGIMLIQTVITLVVVMITLGLAVQSNTAIRETRQRATLATRARDVASDMLLARQLEKEYLLTIGTRNHNVSSEQAAKRWTDAYQKLGTSLSALQPLMQTTAQQEQFNRWTNVYKLYGNAFALIQRQYNSVTDTAQEASDGMSSFDEPLRQLSQETLQVAAETEGNAEQTWVNLLAQREQIATILTGVGAGALLINILLSLTLPNIFIQPIRLLTAKAKRIAGGDFEGRVADDAQHELGDLARAFNHMSEQLSAERMSLANSKRELEEANAEQRQLVEQMQVNHQEREALSTTIRELSIPIIPVLPGIIAVPLVGAFDTQRALDLHRRVLEAIEAQRATRVLLDVTGVPVMDTQVAQTIMQLTDAMRLLGANPVMVGVRPEVAQTLVQLGIRFDALQITSDLQSAVLQYTSGRQLAQTALR